MNSEAISSLVDTEETVNDVITEKYEVSKIMK